MWIFYYFCCACSPHKNLFWLDRHSNDYLWFFTCSGQYERNTVVSLQTCLTVFSWWITKPIDDYKRKWQVIVKVAALYMTESRSNIHQFKKESSWTTGSVQDCTFWWEWILKISATIGSTKSVLAGYWEEHTPKPQTWKRDINNITNLFFQLGNFEKYNIIVDQKTCTDGDLVKKEFWGVLSCPSQTSLWWWRPWKKNQKPRIIGWNATTNLWKRVFGM